jgi:hypothetical protein
MVTTLALSRAYDDLEFERVTFTSAPDFDHAKGSNATGVNIFTTELAELRRRAESNGGSRERHCLSTVRLDSGPDLPAFR